MARIVRELACADTGCNISMTNKDTATRMRRKIEKWDVPKKIKFGNGTTSTATHYVDFGRTLGRLTIVEGADMTLMHQHMGHRQRRKRHLLRRGQNDRHRKGNGEELYRCPGDIAREQ